MDNISSGLFIVQNKKAYCFDGGNSNCFSRFLEKAKEFHKAKVIAFVLEDYIAEIECCWDLWEDRTRDLCFKHCVLLEGQHCDRLK